VGRTPDHEVVCLQNFADEVQRKVPVAKKPQIPMTELMPNPEFEKVLSGLRVIQD